MEAEPECQLADPPATWQEHWFDHRQLLRLYHSDEHCAIYVDPGVRRAEVRWLPRFINVTWQYSKATYGDAFGPDPRIYSIPMQGGMAAAMRATRQPGPDYRNVSDCGLDTWGEGNTLACELPAHEIGHSVESANNGVHGSPAYEIWGDSKWAEFYIYDLTRRWAWIARPRASTAGSPATPTISLAGGPAGSATGSTVMAGLRAGTGHEQVLLELARHFHATPPAPTHGG